MYVPKYHALPEASDAYAVIEAYPLGAWVAPSGGELIANHIPFLLDRSRGKHGTLLGHVARANPVWRDLPGLMPSIVMFHGPQAYITPNWYPSKHQDGKVVPTWNYCVVHAHGLARAIDDRLWLHDMLVRLTTVNEASQQQPWAVSDAPQAYIDQMLRAVVGIEIQIDRLEGKLKVSQDEALQNRRGTVVGLAAAGDSNASALEELVAQAIQTSP